MNIYAVRDKILANMGYACYADYLRSDRWKKIRLRALKRDKFCCRFCGDRATQVHHSRYDKRVLLGQSLKGLCACCAVCHQNGEFDSGRKTTLNECNDRLQIPLTSPQKIWRRRKGLKTNQWRHVSH